MMTTRYRDLAGQRFGQLVVLQLDRLEGEARHRRVYWNCRCDCGREKVVRGDGMTGGVVVSCGCYGAKARSKGTALACTTHGHTRGGRGTARHSPEYTSWTGMRTRCFNPRNPKFKDYGGRGIGVAARWESFANFLADMGPRPKGTTIDRIDVNGCYTPANCRWADALTQRHNRRDSLLGG